jgi:hypothetical protein
VSFTFRSTVPGARFSCRLDAHTYAHCSSPFVVRVGAGVHHFSVSAVDVAGTDLSPANWSFTVKRLPKPHRAH